MTVKIAAVTVGITRRRTAGIGSAGTGHSCWELGIEIDGDTVIDMTIAGMAIRAAIVIVVVMAGFAVTTLIKVILEMFGMAAAGQRRPFGILIAVMCIADIVA